jgi:hypothetical protein
MRVAHLILTYTDPHQTERMIKNMMHENFDFYIHVDKKFDITPHLFLEKIPNVYLLHNRVNVTWAGFDTVKATFECIKEVVNKGISYKYINFLSGQDYPLKPASVISDFFEKSDKEFLSYRDYRNDWNEGLIRIENYFLSNYSFKGKYTIERVINLLLPKRKFPYNLHPYGRSMFWMLSPKVAMYVVNKVENDKKLINFFSLCWGSDEFVFQTILLNSSYKDNIINENFRYIDWSKGGAHPKVLDESDFEALKKSNMLFTRKVNETKSAKLLDLIDLQLLNFLGLLTWLI